MDLRPSTPPGTPAIHPAPAAPAAHPGTVARATRSLLACWQEPLDTPGSLALMGAAAGLALAGGAAVIAAVLNAGIVLPWPPLIWDLWHRVGIAAPAVTIAAGFLSERRLPRLLAGWTLTLQVATYAWDWLPGHVGPTLPLRAAFIAGVAFLAVPALFKRWFFRRPAREDAV